MVVNQRVTSLFGKPTPDWQEEWGETDKTMAEEFQNEMYKHLF